MVQIYTTPILHILPRTRIRYVSGAYPILHVAYWIILLSLTS